MGRSGQSADPLNALEPERSRLDASALLMRAPRPTLWFGERIGDDPQRDPGGLPAAYRVIASDIGRVDRWTIALATNRNLATTRC